MDFQYHSDEEVSIDERMFMSDEQIAKLQDQKTVLSGIDVTHDEKNFLSALMNWIELEYKGRRLINDWTIGPWTRKAVNVLESGLFGVELSAEGCARRMVSTMALRLCGDATYSGLNSEYFRIIRDGIPLTFVRSKGQIVVIVLDLSPTIEKTELFYADGAILAKGKIHVYDKVSEVMTIRGEKYPISQEVDRSFLELHTMKDAPAISVDCEGLYVEYDLDPVVKLRKDGAHYKSKEGLTIAYSLPKKEEEVAPPLGAQLVEEDVKTFLLPSGQCDVFNVSLSGCVLDQTIDDEDSMIDICRKKENGTIADIKRRVERTLEHEIELPYQYISREEYDIFGEEASCKFRHLGNTAPSMVERELVLADYIKDRCFNYEDFLRDIKRYGKGGDPSYVRAFLQHHFIVQRKELFIVLKDKLYYRTILYDTPGIGVLYDNERKFFCKKFSLMAIRRNSRVTSAVIEMTWYQPVREKQYYTVCATQLLPWKEKRSNFMVYTGAELQEKFPAEWYEVPAMGLERVMTSIQMYNTLRAFIKIGVKGDNELRNSFMKKFPSTDSSRLDQSLKSNFELINGRWRDKRRKKVVIDGAYSMLLDPAW